MLRISKALQSVPKGLMIMASLSLIGGCETLSRFGEPAPTKPGTTRYPVDPDIAKRTGSPYRTLKDSQGTLLGDLAIGVPVPALFDGDGDPGAEDRQPASDGSVNTYLWRAALDTVVFMPIEVADKPSGVIQTDWYEDRERPNERFKMNVFIVSDRLQLAGVRVGIFREKRNGLGQGWQQAEVSPSQAEELRSIITNRALVLRDGDAG